MIECRDYELEISALLDGESDPSTAMELLEHVGTCRSCATFVGDVRAVQSKIDRVYVVAGPVFTEGSPPRRDRSIGPMPRWAWAMAATVVITVGGSIALDAAYSNGAVNTLEDGEIVVRLEEDRGAMTEDRFIELTTELLRADRIFRDEMYSVLDAVRSGESVSERTMTEGMSESAEAEGDGRARPLSTNALDE